MSRWEGLDRRRFPRIKYPCLVILRAGAEEKEVILTHTENVGIGGVCVVLKQSIKMFSPVEIELDLLDLGDHIKCEGKVVWNVRRKMEETSKPLYYDIGIEFEKLTKEEHGRLEKIINNLSRSYIDNSYGPNAIKPPA